MARLHRLELHGRVGERVRFMAEHVLGSLATQRHAAAVERALAEKGEWPSVKEAVRLGAEADAAKRAATQAQRAVSGKTGRERSQAEREAKRLREEEMNAHVAHANAHLVVDSDEFDRVLAKTLDVDDYVDLEGFRRHAEHPPFTSQHSAPIPAPAPLQASPEPVFTPPPKPTGLAGVFGQRKYQERWTRVRAEFERNWMTWQEEVTQLPTRQLEQLREQQEADSERQALLAQDRAQYDRECRARQAEVDEWNAALDALITRYRQGNASAVEEYCSIVFEGSAYPDEFEPQAEFSYDEQTRELSVSLQLPAPDDLPTTRAYKYVKARDEITETELPKKEQRDRYASLIYSIVLRTLHELWEADRPGHIAYLSVMAGVEHIDPATGRETTTPLIAVAVQREDFEELNLARVTPAETLKHLNAVLSKNAHALTAIAVPDGVRG